MHAYIVKKMIICISYIKMGKVGKVAIAVLWYEGPSYFF